MQQGLPGIDDPAAVDSWFAGNVAGSRPPLTIDVITGGHSNITYRVRDSGGGSYVLRRPPLGHVLATAHDMGREHRVITAVGATDVPVPATLGLCRDDAVVGAPFYVMDYVEGHVVNTPEDAEAHLPDLGARHRLGEHIIDVLADLHRVDVDAVGLGDLSRREGLLARQLKRWRGQWEATRTRDLPAMDEAYELLLGAMPAQRYTGIVHGDYRMGNLLVRPEGRVAAVLDWELCTLGDVLMDLGYLLNTWVGPGEPDTLAQSTEPATMAGGFPDRDEIIARYADRTGFDVAAVAYYRAFNCWRSAAIAEGVKRRYQEGVMADADVQFDAYERRVALLAQQAVDLVRALDQGALR